ncbi:Tetratricopeptide repeat protein 25 [Holothuria leucospilota]|uniref:Outer dynein arm-docking complex subunit 4 n=1 Tax=Holothuria leucospilota TaxID=206669 RepID=A0A9Q0YBI1_HOLLE|nr:Tetratricopeptide repeat protein 25 [Holothuria leucospilota]
MYESEEQSEGLPKSSFPIYVAEGDVLFKQGEYEKALESYTTERQEQLKLLQSYIGEAEDHMRKRDYSRALEGWNLALEIESNDKNCLVARSKCHLKLGDAKAALKDAEAALEDDPEFNKGLYQKAEALYQSGDFEMSLVFYHRGNKLRPELQEFRLGIQKAQEAIDNSIGDLANVQLDNKGDLSDFYKQDEGKAKKQPRMGYSKPSTKPQEDHKKRKARKELTEKQKETTKQLLGELYADKMYLDKLLKDQDLTRADTESGNTIYDLVSEGIDYLDTRTEFWRQQKPMYARKREKSDIGKQGRKDGKKPVDPTKYILKNLEEIDAAMADGHAKEALKQAQKVLKMVETWDEEDVPDKKELIANLHSCIGNAYLDLNKMPDALHHHQKDLGISKENDNEDGKSRALDNLGRVYARIGKFDAAVDHWSQKLPLIKTPLEATWLYHEIGRCHLELGNYQEARDFGEKSFKAAQEAGDDMWQLNASVLIAQSEVKLGDLQEAIESFERSLEMAKIQGDEPAQSAISKALEELNERIVQGLKERENKEEAKDGSEEEKEKQKDEEETVEKEEVKEEEKKDASNRSSRASSVTSLSSPSPASHINKEDDANSPTQENQPKQSSRPSSQTSVKSTRNSRASVASSGRNSRSSLKSTGSAKSRKQKNAKDSKKSQNRSGSAKSVSLPERMSDVSKEEELSNEVKDGDDGKKEETLSSKADGLVEHADVNKDETETYRVYVKTADERGAGTDSRVHINLFGQNGETGVQYLENSVHGGDIFEQGNTDEFILHDVLKVGEITKVKIGHDNKGAFAGWMLAHVEVEAPSLSKKLYFPCHMWLDDDEGDGKTERELEPGEIGSGNRSDSD